MLAITMAPIEKHLHNSPSEASMMHHHTGTMAIVQLRLEDSICVLRTDSPFSIRWKTTQ